MRGCERKIIMLKGTNSEIFDEAYFLIRRDYKESGRKSEIVSEAQRIVNMNTTHHRREMKNKKERGAFFTGVGVGFLLGLLWLLF